MIFLDLETSGLDPVKDGILSIGAVDLDNPDEFFYAEPKLPRGKEIDDKALKINGFTRYDSVDSAKKTLANTLHEFQKWLSKIKEVSIAGHNPSFDADFLRQAFKEEGFEWVFGHRYVDIHSTAISTYLSKNIEIPRKHGRFAVNLDHILWSVGLPKRSGPHNALTDAKLEAEAYQRLIHGESWSYEFTKYPVTLRGPVKDKKR
jgi:DNA polymerase III epsilon subunit-like protein